MRAGSVRAHNGIATVAQCPLAEIAGPIDTLLVTGGLSVPEQLLERRLIEQIARLAQSSRRIASVCNGAFLLAEAGLLAGRRATTHWLMADELDSRYADVEVGGGLVVYLHRPGGQSQFSTPMRANTPRSEPLRQLQAFIDANPRRGSQRARPRPTRGHERAPFLPRLH